MTAGEIVVSGGNIRSSNYNADLRTGWTISYDGTAELNNAIIRNNVSAGNSIFGGSASGYASGPGFFAGWDSSVYKWRVGIGGAQRVTWDGSAFSIYDHGAEQLVRFSGSESYIKLGSATYDPDRFVLSGTNQRLTLRDANRERVILGRHSTGDYGLTLYDANGGLVLSSGGELNLGRGTNLVPNSDLAVPAGTSGDQANGWDSVYISNSGTGYTYGRDLSGDSWRPVGAHTIGMRRDGTARTAAGTLIFNTGRIAVVPGQRYEISAYVAAHRCNAAVHVKFHNSSGTGLGESAGNQFKINGGTNLSGWGRSSLFYTAPANSSYALVSLWAGPWDGSGYDCYHWGTRFYMGVAGANQTVLSEWSSSSITDFSQYGFPFNASTIGTYMSAAAITQAYIGNAAIGSAQIGDLQVTQVKIADYNVTFGTSFTGGYVSINASNWTQIGIISNFNLLFYTDMLVTVAAYNSSSLAPLIVGLRIDSDSANRAIANSTSVDSSAYASLSGVHGFTAGLHTVKVMAKLPVGASPSIGTAAGNIFLIGRYK
jgi:hypothetical protein